MKTLCITLFMHNKLYCITNVVAVSNTTMSPRNDKSFHNELLNRPKIHDYHHNNYASKMEALTAM